MKEYLQHGCFIFATKSSLRGVGKIHSSQHSILRALWLLFVLIMLSLLFYGVIDVMKEYFYYGTTIQTKKISNDYTDFPTITFCMHRPFSDNAHTFWQSGKVKSPNKFSKELREIMKHSVEERDYLTAQALFFSDKLSTYFQNLKKAEVNDLSHEISDLLIYCILKYGNITSVGHIDDCDVEIYKIISPTYFNCFMIMPRSHISSKLETASFVIKMGHGQADHENFEHGFVQNILAQSHGLRITLHEGRSYPIVDKQGFSVVPDYYSEIKYSVKKNHRIDRPGKSCFNEDQVKERSIKDEDGKVFSYTADACISAKIGEIILRECKCISAFHIQSSTSTDEKYTYCNKVDLANAHYLIDNMQCLRRIDEESLRKSLSETECLESCNESQYSAKVSSSKWLPARWQMEWSKLVSDAWRTFGNESSSPQERENAHNNVLRYVNSTNLTINWPNLSSDDAKELDISSNYLLVSISRSDFITMESEEKLIITSSTLISRIGGLGSLTMGLSLAFLIELFETIFLTYKSRNLIRQAKKKETSEGSELIDKRKDSYVKKINDV